MDHTDPNTPTGDPTSDPPRQPGRLGLRYAALSDVGRVRKDNKRAALAERARAELAAWAERHGIAMVPTATAATAPPRD